MTQSAIHSVAAALVDARRSGFRIKGLAPATVPDDLDTAYAIQDALILASDQKVGGWKVAAGTGDAPICAPLPANALRTSGVALSVTRSFARLAEAEVAVRIGHDMPPRDTPYTDDDVLAAIGGILPVIELIGSPFERDFSVPHFLNIANLQGNSDLVLGPEFPDWSGLDFANLAITLEVGTTSATKTTGPDLAAILAALRFLANGRARAHGGLKAGDIITTGSRINLPAGDEKTEIIATFDPLGSVSLTLI
ncbi:MAG: 2-keto-4-pentenoate hydratase [Cypionkella sp.]